MHIASAELKKNKPEPIDNHLDDQWLNVDSGPSSPHSDNSPNLTASEEVPEGNFLDVEGDTALNNSKYFFFV